MLQRLTLLILLLSLSVVSFAQQADSVRISGTFNRTPFPDFVKELEARTAYRFYFNPADVDSLSVTLQATGKPLAAVLEQALSGTALKFAIDADKHVFVTAGAPIETKLPDSFFQPENSGAIFAAEPDPEPQGNNRRQNISEQKLYEIGIDRGSDAGSKATLAGYVRDSKSGEPVIGASVFVEKPSIGTATDQFGFFSLTLPVGRYELKIRGIGIKNAKRQISLHSDGKLNIEVEEDIARLREVVIEAEKDRNVAGMQMGVEKLDIKTIRQVPTTFGETDILRVVLTLPGVKSVSEGTTGMNVRGGAADQNLILFNDATVYNPAHLFGFFSAFNPDIIKSVELFKSAIPAKYGGRLSSVLDITTRDGNKKKFAGAGGIGPLTSRLMLEGPILKDKSSFIISGRSSYSDWLLKQIPNKSYQESSAFFYDVNAHITHDFNSKNTLYLTGYSSSDKFRLASDTTYRYQNQNATLKFKHVFGNKLYGVFTGTYSHYAYDVASERNPSTSSRLTYGIDQTGGQLDFSYFPSSKHTIDFGASTLLYNISPGSLTPLGGESLMLPDVLPRERGLENALYISDKIDISNRFSVYAGVRFSLYAALGPRDIYRYLADASKSESTITDTISYASGKVMGTYQGPELRLSAKYAVTENSSVKVSYNQMRQYIHMLSNTASMSPTDIWKLSDPNVRPQLGDQYSIGYYRNYKRNTVETSVEVYYKNMRDFVDYKSGATLLLNHHIETDVVNAKGVAYGMEMMLKKLSGKLNGWVSYTYSRSLVQVNNATTGDLVNGGKFYPSNFDKPHDFMLVSNYRFSRRFSASFNMNYSTGRPITLPLAKYQVGNTVRVYYSARNAYRVPDYFRTDFSLNIEGNHKVKKAAHGSWTLGVYNLTGRRNPFSVYFKSENGQIKGYKLAIFGTPIPTITYNFKF
ncbi:TonB-dependent receptor [Hymenobacter sp. BT730]|uniref:TonB-dependent receptor n=1 Tax=Hymenobacter sp. BT730 TaxID=3063332 RepID=UPI0026DEE022|nr:TonB-dependent receptor [Hymenobacter sp. BT730]